MNDEKVNNAFYIMGSAESFAAGVAAKVPEEFAEAVRRWYPSELSEIIEALSKQKFADDIEDILGRFTEQKEG